MNKREILDKIVSYYAQGNYAKFSKMLGLKPGTVSSWKYRGSYDIDIITAHCRDISYKFLQTGEGPILQSDVNKNGQSNNMPDIASELSATMEELTRQLSDLRQELAEERRARQDTLALMNRILDIYTNRIEYPSMVAETAPPKKGKAV